MGFPVVQSVTTTSFEPATSHPVNMPASVSSGDLLVMFFSLGWHGNGVDVTTPSGWTQKYKILDTGSFHQGSCFVKVASGSEGGTTVDVVSINGSHGVAQVYRITNWFGTLAAVETATATGNSTNPSSPNLTPSWGAGTTLWLSAYTADAYDSMATAYPTNYTDGTTAESSTSTTGNECSVGSARRELNATSEDPTAFTISGTRPWVAATLAVRPIVITLTAVVSAAVSTVMTITAAKDAAIAAQLSVAFLNDAAVQAPISGTFLLDGRTVLDQAIIEIHEFNGAGGTPTNKTGGAIVYKSIDNQADNSDNPIIRPTSGQRYSYQKWLRAFVDGAFFAVLNIRAYTDGVNGLGTGIKLWWAKTPFYLAPVVPDSADDPPLFGGLAMTNAFFYTSASPLILGEGPYGIGDAPNYAGDFLVSVLEVESTAPAGISPSETMSIAWDEV